MRFLLSDHLLGLHLNANHSIGRSGRRRHHLSVREVQVTQVDSIMLVSVPATITALTAVAQHARTCSVVATGTSVDSAQILRRMATTGVVPCEARRILLVDDVSACEPEVIRVRIRGLCVNTVVRSRIDGGKRG